MARVKGALEAVPGVRQADVSLEKGEARVRYDPAVCDVASLAKAVTDAGFEAAAKSE